MKNKNENISNEEMTNDLMNELLLDFSDTPYYRAVSKYVTFRYSQVDNGLRTIDPFKNPTEMARTQGFFGGLSDLFKHIEQLKAKVKEREEPIKE